MNIYGVFLMLRGKNHFLATIRQTDTFINALSSLQQGKLVGKWKAAVSDERQSICNGI